VLVSPELVTPKSTTQESDSADVENARDSVVAALDAGGHKTAAALLAAGRWTVGSDGAIQAEVGIKTTMLGLTMNAEAWRIAREALTAIGIRQKLTVVPGSGIGGAAEEAAEGAQRASHTPISGSIQAVAMENPLVRRAQELFPGEVRSVLDLRERSQGNSRNNR
jgi:DNA polymerase-3 subunit gamma/tau